MVQIYYRNIKESAATTLSEFRKGSWIYVENPTDKEISDLVDNFSLETGHLQDARDIYEVPRLEVEENNIYIFTRYAYTENSQVYTAPVLFIIGPDFFITISEKPYYTFKKFIDEKSFYTTQKVKLFLQLLMQINQSYNSFVNNISKDVRRMGIELEKVNNKDIVKFVRYESFLNDFLAALVPTNAILQNLLSGKYIKLYEEDKDLIEDLQLNTNQLIDISKSNLRNIVNYREAYSAIMTNKLNQVIKLFTALTVILTIPMIVSSIYGMNVRLPFEQNPSTFYGIITILLVLSLSIGFLFWKKRWL